MSEESFSELFNQSCRDEVVRVQEGKKVTGVIVSIRDGFVFVDLGFKTEGCIKKAEVIDFNGKYIYSIGDEITCKVDFLDNGFGQMLLSYDDVKQELSVEEIVKSLSGAHYLSVYGKAMNPRGISIDFQGLECFIPTSLSGMSSVDEMAALVNTEFKVKIVKFEPEKKNILASRKHYLEKDRLENSVGFLQSLNVGDRISGVAKTITNYGAFISLAGIDSLVHLNDIAWQKVAHPSERINKNETYDFIVKDIDMKRKRVSISLKEANLEPWLNIVNQYHVGDSIDANVVEVDDSGALVRVNNEFDTYVYKTELAWHVSKDTTAQQLVSVGQKIKLKVNKIDIDSKTLLLSAKELLNNPFHDFAKKNNVEDVVSGQIVSVTPEGIEISIDELYIFIHKDHISWDPKLATTNQFHLEQTVDCKITQINTENQQVKASIKEITGNPLNKYRNLTMDQTFQASITAIENFKVKLITDDFAPVVIQTSLPSKEIKQIFSINDTVTLNLLKVQRDHLLSQPSNGCLGNQSMQNNPVFKK
jgi:small subunit ribosomal protein S1